MTKLTTLTTSNAEMAATIKKITGENRQLQQQLNSLKKILQDKQGPGRRQAAVGQKYATCTNCKQEFWNKPGECFELDNNVAWRPAGQKTRLRRCGVANNVFENKLGDNFSANKIVVLPPTVANNPQCTQPNNQNTGVIDSGARNIFILITYHR